MNIKKINIWVIGIVLAIASYVPILFLLAKTPIHDGSELPSSLMLVITLALCVLLGIVGAKIAGKFIY